MKGMMFFQNLLIGLGVFLLVALPASSLFIDIGFEMKGILYTVSFASVFLLMLIRPFADIFIDQLWLRKLVFLRKGMGILSASIIIGFMISAIIAPESTYLTSFFTTKFWSFYTLTLFAHLGDVTGLVLLITSNRFSQKVLKQNWKRVQRLSYVYFYAGGVYEAFALENNFALYAVLVVTNLTVLAWAIKAWRRSESKIAFSENASI
jgi:DMSO/TMAO reductase YedYZ heme-binding membrane subunit